MNLVMNLVSTRVKRSVSRARLAAIPFLCLVLLRSANSFAQIVINEIMANPEGSDTYTEYVELYNRSLFPVDLTGWRIGNDGGEDSLRPAPDSDAMVLGAGGYAVILESGYGSDGVFLYRGLIPENALRLSVDDAAIGSGGLTNSVSQTVRLVRADGSLISSRTYRPFPPGGVSEERIRVEGGETDDNWAFSTQGGTPGFVNSVTPLPDDLTIDTVLFVFPEDGDTASVMKLSVINCGTEVASIGRVVHIELADTGGTSAIRDSTDLTALSPNERQDVEWELPELPGGPCRLLGWLSPPDDRAANDTIRMQPFLSFPFGTLRIMEVMPNPPSSVDAEWVEIRNDSPSSVDLADWILTDATGTKGRLVRSTLFLEPDSVVVLAGDSILLEWPELPETVLLLTPGSWPSLNNRGDTLALVDPSGTRVDWVAYPAAAEGMALQRAVVTDDPDASMWTASPDPLGGTPGERNPAAVRLSPGERPTVAVSPSPFSPDGDGYEDQTVFTFRFPAVQITVTLRLYDRIGRPVGTLLSDRLLPGSAEWTWDGHRGLKRGTLPLGIYVWHVETKDPASGRHWVLKGTLVSAGS